MEGVNPELRGELLPRVKALLKIFAILRSNSTPESRKEALQSLTCAEDSILALHALLPIPNLQDFLVQVVQHLEFQLHSLSKNSSNKKKKKKKKKKKNSAKQKQKAFDLLLGGIPFLFTNLLLHYNHAHVSNPICLLVCTAMKDMHEIRKEGRVGISISKQDILALCLDDMKSSSALCLPTEISDDCSKSLEDSKLTVASKKTMSRQKYSQLKFLLETMATCEIWPLEEAKGILTFQSNDRYAYIWYRRALSVACHRVKTYALEEDTSPGLDNELLIITTLVRMCSVAKLVCDLQETPLGIVLCVLFSDLIERSLQVKAARELLEGEKTNQGLVSFFIKHDDYKWTLQQLIVADQNFIGPINSKTPDEIFESSFPSASFQWSRYLREILEGAVENPTEERWWKELYELASTRVLAHFKLSEAELVVFWEKYLFLTRDAELIDRQWFVDTEVLLLKYILEQLWVNKKEVAIKVDLPGFVDEKLEPFLKKQGTTFVQRKSLVFRDLQILFWGQCLYLNYLLRMRLQIEGINSWEFCASKMWILAVDRLFLRRGHLESARVFRHNFKGDIFYRAFARFFILNSIFPHAYIDMARMAARNVSSKEGKQNRRRATLQRPRASDPLSDTGCMIIVQFLGGIETPLKDKRLWSKVQPLLFRNPKAIQQDQRRFLTARLGLLLRCLCVHPVDSTVYSTFLKPETLWQHVEELCTMREIQRFLKAELKSFVVGDWDYFLAFFQDLPEESISKMPKSFCTHVVHVCWAHFSLDEQRSLWPKFRGIVNLSSFSPAASSSSSSVGVETRCKRQGLPAASRMTTSDTPCHTSRKKCHLCKEPEPEAKIVALAFCSARIHAEKGVPKLGKHSDIPLCQNCWHTSSLSAEAITCRSDADGQACRCNLAGGVYGDKQNPHYFKGWAPLNEEAPAAIPADDPPPVRSNPETQSENEDEKGRTKQQRKSIKLTKSQRKKARKKQIEEEKLREYAAVLMQNPNPSQVVSSLKIKPKARVPNPQKAPPGAGERASSSTSSDEGQPVADKNTPQKGKDKNTLLEEQPGLDSNLAQELVYGFFS